MVSWIGSMMVLLISFSSNGLKLHPREKIKCCSAKSICADATFSFFSLSLLLHEIEHEEDDDDDDG